MALLSPTLSSVTRTTDQSRNSGTSGESSSTSANISSNYNYNELFEDVDWSSVNLIDIESDWRHELDQIEQVIVI